MEVFNLNDISNPIKDKNNVTIYLIFNGSKINTDTAVDILNVSERTRNALYKNGIFRLGDLLKKRRLIQKIVQGKIYIVEDDIIDFFNIQGIGTTGIKEIYDNLVGVQFEIEGGTLKETDDENNKDEINLNHIECFIIKNGIKINTNQPVETLNISERTRNGLHRGGLFFIKDVLKNRNLVIRAKDSETTISDEDIVNLYRLKGMGVTCVSEICDSLVGANFITQAKEISNDDLLENNEKYINICSTILSCGFPERLTNALHKSNKLYLKDLLEEDVVDSILVDGNKIKFKTNLFSKYLYLMRGLGKKNIDILVDYFHGSILVGEDIEETEETLEDKLQTIINKNLTEREVLIFNKKSEFGNCSDNITLDGVAAEVGVTRERVRQLLTKAEEKIRLAISLLGNENLGKKIIDKFFNDYGEIGVLDLSNEGSENINSKFMALGYKEILSQTCDVFYLGNKLKPSNVLLCIKKNLVEEKLLLKGFGNVDKFVEEKRPIDRHYYIKDFYNNVFGLKYCCERKDIYEKSFLYYLEYEYGIKNDDGVVGFPSNRINRTILAAQVFFYEKDGLTYDELETVLKREYPSIEWTYSILSNCFLEFCKKDGDIYYLDEKKAKKIIKIFAEEEPFRYYRIINNKFPETSWEEKDYSNTKYYFLIEKIRTGYKSDALRKKGINDYLYTIYSGENIFSIIQFLKLFVASLSEVEVDILRYDYQYIGLYDTKTNKQILEDKNIGIIRLLQIKNRLLSKMNEIIGGLTRIEAYSKIIESLIDEFQISEYKVIDSSEETESDDINGKFISYALKIILSKNFNTRYLSWDGNESEAIMVYNKDKFDDNFINYMFESLDASYELLKNRKSIDIGNLISLIFNDNLKIEKFNENSGYKYFLKEYLLYTYNIIEDNGQFIFPEIELKNSDIDSFTINKLLELLHDDVYTNNQIETIFSKYGISYEDYDNILESLGYKHKGLYYIKKKFNNFKDYLSYKCQKDDMIRLDKELFDNETLFNAIIDYRQSYKIFKINEELYITIAKMGKLGIGTTYIDNFFKRLKNHFGDSDFFSIHNVKNSLDVKIFWELGFDDEFLENIIYYNNEISSLQIKGRKLFSYSMNDISTIKFIEYKMEKFRVISLSNFVNEINEEYGLDLDYDILRNCMWNLTNVFYSQTMDKLYLDKEDFYNEVYNND